MGFRIAVRILFLEPFTGISGDMLLGALLDLGVPQAELDRQVKALGLGDRVELRVSKTERGGITATKVDVLVDGQLEAPHETGAEAAGGTTVEEVLGRLDTSSLEPGIGERAGEVFRRLSEAEARVHGTTPGRVHLHEVGAIDAVVDVVCSVAAVAYLGVERVLSAPPCEGHGEVQSTHGVLPVPAPATAYLLEGVPLSRVDIPCELVTPTGAALLVCLVDSFTNEVELTPERVGYGAGTRHLAGRPNVLRATVGSAIEPTATNRDRVVILETIVDDAIPELWPHLIDCLLDAGARDAYLIPVVMKKGRPGLQLTVLGDHHHLAVLERLIFEETGTLGMRITEADRHILPRARGVLATNFGPLHVKCSRLPGESRWRVRPEYEACRAAALQHEVPLADVYAEVGRAATVDGALTVEEKAEEKEDEDTL